MLGGTTISSGSHNPTTTAAASASTLALDVNDQQLFSSEKCLFCNKNSDDSELNLLHMHTTHGLFIPDRRHLIVELHVLLEYLHLVIHGYHECICCGTQRNTTLAVQQHMLGKSHCRFDIAEEGSEYADFWNLSDSGSDEDMSSEEDEPVMEERTYGRPMGKAVQLDGSSLRLPSGKLISKSSPSQQHKQRKEGRIQRAATAADGADIIASEIDGVSVDLISSSSSGPKSITKSEKRAQVFTTQLSRLSDNDRRSLMHLPTSQQRSILATQQRQAEKAKKAERRYESRVEGLGNKTLQANYRAAGPMRPNG